MKLEGAEQALYTAKKHMEKTQSPYALLVKRQTFTPYKMQRQSVLDGMDQIRIKREEAIQAILEAVHDRDVIVGTTGMLSRQVLRYSIKLLALQHLPTTPVLTLYGFMACFT